MLSLYQLKPKFQDLLRPLARECVNRGYTANQVTLLAMGISVFWGILLVMCAKVTWLFWLLPIWLLVRMALNAIDGMMAKEFMQESALGGYLNEVGDVIADAALFLPFAFIIPMGGLTIGLFIWLAALSEVVGILGAVHGYNGRRYDGPLGKSDRALAFAILAIWYAISGSLNMIATLILWLMIVALLWTCWQRLQNGLRASSESV